MVFFAVLNMGLGHASRSLPVITELIERGWKVVVGSSGRSLKFLEKELPQAGFLELPDYGLEYSPGKVRLTGLAAQLPSLLKRISEEKTETERFVRRNAPDLIASDHRYGCSFPGVPSYFISHQLRFAAPGLLRAFEFSGVRFNRLYHRNFEKIIVPDIHDGNEGILSGRLSAASGKENYMFAGTLSSIRRKAVDGEPVDLLISVSGPEPLRTEFENLIRTQLPEVPGKKVVALGKPESDKVEKVNEDLLIFDHVTRPKMEELMNRSKLIVSRAGYSTLMELAELGKPALLIPTPGQTEQEYLAERLHGKGWCLAVRQQELDFKKHIDEAGGFSGLPDSFSTRDSVQKICGMFEKAVEARGRG